ncbi:MAG: putative membrane protein [Alphaproteobacteria bacterium]|jgi:putative membrane protein
MENFINNYYLEIKAVHLIAVFAWMAGLFYLPRLFVYHADPNITDESSAMLMTMERRLLRAIMNPAMILAWITGILLIIYQINIGGFSAGWLHTKITSVIILTGFHQLLAYHRKQFERSTNQKSHLYYRIINEIPTLFLIIIVYCVIVKPF